MSFHFSPKTITNGLILNIDAANPSCYTSGSSIAKDLTKNGRNCTLNNVGYSSFGGGSFTFGGTSSNWIKIPSTETLTDFTISIWFQSTGVPSDGLSIYSTLISYTGINRILVATGVNKFILTQMSGGNYFSTDVCPFNTWNNVTYTYNSSTSIQQLYINNIKQTPVSTSGITYTSNIHYLGTDPNINPPNNVYLMRGYISTLQIYNRTLSDDEVVINFNALKTRFGL